MKALKRKDDNIKLIALWGLGYFNSLQTSQILIGYLSHKNVFLRLAALRGIRPEALHKLPFKQLKGFIKNRDIRVRLYALEALKGFLPKEKGIRQLLYAALYDSEYLVRQKAFEILKSGEKSIVNRGKVKSAGDAQGK